MAKLNDTAKDLGVDGLFPKPSLPSDQPTLPSQEKAAGRKRRDWLSNDDESNEPKGVYTPLNEKGSMNPIDKPHLSTPNINPIYQPLSEKRSIDPIKKPLDLNLEKLRGNPLKIAQYIFELLKPTANIITEKVTLLEMMKALEISKDSARTGLRFLLKNNLVIRIELQLGKHGWSKYELNKSLFDELKKAYQKGSINPLKQKGSNSSSGFNNIKETTTTEMGEEWNFDIASYAKFGFTKTQIKQLASLGVISAADVEQSLIEFSFDLESNSPPKINGTKAAYLMGILRKGQSYVSEGFKNEQESTISEMAKRAKEKRDRLNKEKFEAWEDALSDEERKEIEKSLPPHLMVLHRAHGIDNAEVRKWMFDYYLEKRPFTGGSDV